MEREGIALWAGPAKGVQNPLIFLLIMAKDVDVSVIGKQLEAAVADAVPLIKNFHHLKCLGILIVSVEPTRPFVSPMAGVTFNSEGLRHRRL
jgi:hypothetical protein